MTCKAKFLPTVGLQHRPGDAGYRFTYGDGPDESGFDHLAAARLLADFVLELGDRVVAAMCWPEPSADDIGRTLRFAELEAAARAVTYCGRWNRSLAPRPTPPAEETKAA